MAEEKVTNEEVLDEEQLEEVAGGTRKEIKKDIEMLRHYKIIGENQTPSMQQINDGIIEIGRRAGMKMGYNPSEYAKNKYYDNHDAKSQEEFWNKIRGRLGY